MSGNIYNGSAHNVGSYGYYLSSELDSTERTCFYVFRFTSDNNTINRGNRQYGYSIRSVLTIKSPKLKDKYQKMEYKVGDFDSL